MRWRRCWCGRATRRRPSAVLEESESRRSRRRDSAGCQRIPAARTRTQWRRGVRRRAEGRDSASEVEARRSLPGVRKGQRIRAEGAEGAGADRGTGAAGGYRLLAGAVALRRLRAGVHRARAGRRGSGKVRRDGGGDDRAAQVRQRNAVLPAGTTGSVSWGFRCRRRRSGRSSRKRRS